MRDYRPQWIHNGLTCRDVAEQASEYLDDRPTRLIKIRIGLHLSSCTHCRTYVKQLALVRDTIAFLPGQHPSTINRLRLQQHFARCILP
jgi:predicted anti-sigma-YlaC factor YlaD